MRTTLQIIILVVFATAVLLAPRTAAAETSQPYAGQENRNIKALSPSDVEGLKKGNGMGFAKSAELNHYPGPLHSLENRTALNLTDSQLTAIIAAQTRMRNRAIALGEKVIEGERSLDELFATGRATADGIRQISVEVGRLRGELRATHLEAHLDVKNILTKHQTTMYDSLRGYTNGQDHNGQSHGGHR